MLSRLVITLNEAERNALQAIAASELRDMREQVRFILRSDLERRGLLSDDSFTCPHCGREINKENKQS